MAIDVLFVCVHNAGRSQMAEALFNRRATELGKPWRAASAGTMPGGAVQEGATKALAEMGIDLTGHSPKQLTADMANEAKKVVTMGCGVDVAACPGRFMVSEDWGLDDPSGRPMEEVRSIRDQIDRKVLELLNTLASEHLAG